LAQAAAEPSMTATAAAETARIKTARIKTLLSIS
jgi:hypothetical protein